MSRTNDGEYSLQQACDRAEAMSLRLEQLLQRSAQVGDEVERHIDRLGDARQESVKAVQDARTMLGESRVCRDSLHAEVKTADQRVQQLGSLAAAVTSAQNTAMSAIQRISDGNAEIQSMAKTAETAAGNLRSVVDESEANATLIRERLAEDVGEGQIAQGKLERGLQEVDAKTNRVEEQIRSLDEVHGHVSEMTGMVQQVCQQASSQASEARRASLEVLDVVAQAQSTAADARQHTERAIQESKHKLDSWRRGVGDLFAQGDVDAGLLQERVENALKMTSQKFKEAHLACDVVEGAGKRMDDQVASGNEILAKMQVLSEQLQARTDNATERQDSMASLLVEADSKIGHIELSVSEAALLIKQMTAAVPTVSEAAESLERQLSLANSGGAEFRSTVDAARKEAESFATWLSSQVSEAGGVRHDLETMVATIQTLAEESAAREQNAAEIVKASEAKKIQLSEAAAESASFIEQLSSLLPQARESSDTLKNYISQTHEIDGHFVAHLKSSRDEIDCLSEKVGTRAIAVDRLLAVVQSRQTELQAVVGKSLDCENTLDGLFAESSTHGAKLSDLIGVAGKATDRLIAETPKAVTAVKVLDQRMKKIDQADGELVEHIESAQEEIASVSERVKSRATAVDQLLVEVQSRQTDLKGVVAQSESLEETLDHLLSESQTSGAKLAELIATAAEAKDRLIADTPKAVAVVDALDQRMNKVHEADGDLLEHIGDARAADEQCVEHAKHAMELMQSIQEQTHDCDATTQRLQEAIVAAKAAEQVPLDLKSLIPQARDLQELLDVQYRDGKTVLGEMSVETNKARNEIIKCSKQAAAASQAGQALRELIDGSGSATERAGRAIVAAKLATDRLSCERESARATIERQQVFRDKGSMVLDQMEQHSSALEKLISRLGEATESAGQINETLEQTRDQSAQSVYDLSHQIQTAESSKAILDASQKTMNDFLAKAEHVEEHLQQIQAQADSMEAQLSKVIHRPEQVVAEARAQAAQLQGVSRAVRKVFAGLSEAALQAKRRTDQFHKMGESAASRTSELRSEMGMAAETLRTWVEEATSVQRRLADTVNNAPRLGETHPPESLSGIAQLAGAVATPSDQRVLRRLETVVSPSAERARPVARDDDDHLRRNKSRAEEISRLLEDARKFSEAVS